ncbi:MAG: type 4a pilus biogenesis protein PilO [Candidatus Omnitrophica bacterium]|nr:type 4a pilus biogenesis protein PilO [Candidatus Omnitrophota bacterium]
MKPHVIFGILVFLVGVLLGGQRVHEPAQARLSQVNRDFRSEQQTQELRLQVAKLLDEVEQFRRRLSPEPESSWLVGQVGKLAEQAKIELTSIAPQPSKAIQEFTRLAVLIQFSTSYHELGNFLSMIESSPAFIRVEELSMANDYHSVATGGGSSEEYQPNVKLMLSTLYVSPFSGGEHR